MVFLIVMIVVSSRTRTGQTRAQELRILGDRLRFDDFNPSRDEAFAMGWGFLGRLSQGDRRYASNILRGKYHDESLFVFDYHYQTGSGSSTEEHEFTMLMLVSREAFSQVVIEPGGESVLSKMAAAFGAGDDIKFESAEFSRTFCVRSVDKRFGYSVCNPQMIEYLLANPSLRVEINGPAILLAFEPPLPVGEIELNLQRLAEIRSRLPEYLFTSQ
jgi:hypothetical protein